MLVMNVTRKLIAIWESLRVKETTKNEELSIHPPSVSPWSCSLRKKIIKDRRVMVKETNKITKPCRSGGVWVILRKIIKK